MSWQLFDRIAAYLKQANVYRRDNLFRDQSSLDKIVASGEFLNFRQQHSLLEQTNLQINRLERYKDFDQMDEVGEIHLALDIYADEASLIDPELKHTINIKSKSKRVKRELDELFFTTLLIDHCLRPMIRYLVKYGDAAFEIIPTKTRNAVAALRHMNIYNFTRVETRFGDLIGFYFQDQLTTTPQFMHPWQVMHMRLTSYENIYHPYGQSILSGARKHFKQLRLMEDAALIYRITRAPEKRVFTVPVGNIPTSEVPQYIELIARNFKKKKFFDPATGDVNERWHPLIQEDDFWLPQRADGTGPTVTTLPGAENLDSIKDIEYFKKKMVSALKIPFSKVGLGEGNENDNKAVSHVSPDFAKAIQWIQREVAISLKKVAIVHLALRGFSEEEIKSFDIHMTASSAIDELYRIETWSSRADVIGALKDTEMFTNKWILNRFTDLTNDEIDELEEEKAAQMAMMPQQPGMGGMGGGGGASMMRLGAGGPPPGGMPPGGEMPGGMPGSMPGGEGAEGLSGGPPPGGAPPPMPEGYDIGLEQQLLTEVTNYHRRKQVPPTRIRPSYLREDIEWNSGWENMLHNCEFDGLTTMYQGKEHTLVESVISKSVIAEARKEAEMLIVHGDEEPIVEDDTITAADLPTTTLLSD
jgi:hypothetical protein